MPNYYFRFKQLWKKALSLLLSLAILAGAAARGLFNIMVYAEDGQYQTATDTDYTRQPSQEEPGENADFIVLKELQATQTDAHIPKATFTSYLSGVTLDKEYDNKNLILTIYGKTEDKSGKIVSATTPVIQWSGKNLAIDAYYMDNVFIYNASAWMDLALLTPGENYVLSCDVQYQNGKTGPVVLVPGNPLLNTPGYAEGTSKIEIPFTMSSKYSRQELAAGIREVILKNGQNEFVQVRNLQIELDYGSRKASDYEEFCGGNIVMTDIVLRSVGDVYDEISLHEDGLWKITRRVSQENAAPSVLGKEFTEVLDTKYQLQLDDIVGKEGMKIEVFALNGVNMPFNVQPSTQEQFDLMHEEADNLYGGYIGVQNGNLYDENGKEFTIKSINTGDSWGSNFSIASHSQSIYRQIADFGFNSVRICFNYDKFEYLDWQEQEYLLSERGFAEAKRSIENARQQGLRVIFDMHVPQGGWNAVSEGRPLFDIKNTDLQDRFVNMWAGIAQEFAGNDTILGYSLCNEAALMYMGSEEKAIENYDKVIQRTIDAIREYDQEHVIIVMPAFQYYSANDECYYPWSGPMNISDPCDNLMIESHLYFSTESPYGEDSIMPYFTVRRNIDSNKISWLDSWRKYGYYSSDDNQATAIIEIPQSQSNETFLGNIVLFGENMAGSGIMYMENLIVERYKNDNQDQKETIINIHPEQTGLVSAFTNLNRFSVEEFPQYTSNKCWRIENMSWNVITAEKDTLGQQIVDNIILKPGYTYEVKVNVNIYGAPENAKARIAIMEKQITPKAAVGYSSTGAPVIIENKFIATVDKQKATLINTAWGDRWHDKGYSMSKKPQSNWQTVSAEFSRGSGDGVNLLSAIIHGGKIWDGQIYIKNVKLEKKPDNGFLSETMLNITPENQMQALLLTNFNEKQVTSKNGYKCWELNTQNAGSYAEGEVYFELMNNILLEPGYTYLLSVDMCVESKDSGANSRIKTYTDNWVSNNSGSQQNYGEDFISFVNNFAMGLYTNNIYSTRLVIFDDWKGNAIDANGSKWREMSAEVEIDSHEAKDNTLIKPILHGEKLNKNTLLYIDKITIERYKTGSASQKETLLQITPWDTELLSSYESIEKHKIINYPGDKSKKCWVVSPIEGGSTIYKELLGDMIAEPGYTYKIILNTAMENENYDSHARFKIYKQSIVPSEKAAELPAVITNDAKGLEAIMRYHRNCAEQMGAAFYVSETGYMQKSLNDVSNYEEWARDMSRVLSEYSNGYSFHNVAGPELGLWSDYEATVLNQERARIIKDYFL